MLAALYWRLGWEVGVVSSTLATNGLNWGYFFDHNPFEPHCNQHPNNFVILPPVSGVWGLLVWKNGVSFDGHMT